MMRRLILAGAVLLIGTAARLQAQQAPKVYNTRSRSCSTASRSSAERCFRRPAMYCAMANAGFDFLWIEMQHSPLTYQEVARMIFACRGSAGMPFIRVPDATESDIQKATDIGAIGVIVPPSIPSRRPRPR
jgi:2,4-dihydroxyhept-2-ene-1,7-dioic acid aldolase